MITQEQYLAAIKKELDEDPCNLGYAGKTAGEQVTLMNSIWYLNVPQPQTPRILMIIQGISEAPNVVNADDITAAMSS